MSATHTCPVCGYAGLDDPPWQGGAPSDEICPSCGTHFGYDDAAGGDVERMQAAISTDFLEVLTAVGDEAGVRAGIARYQDAGTTSPCVGPIAGTDFDGTLRAGAPGG